MTGPKSLFQSIITAPILPSSQGSCEGAFNGSLKGITSKPTVGTSSLFGAMFLVSELYIRLRGLLYGYEGSGLLAFGGPGLRKEGLGLCRVSAFFA